MQSLKLCAAQLLVLGHLCSAIQPLAALLLLIGAHMYQRPLTRDPLSTLLMVPLRGTAGLL